MPDWLTYRLSDFLLFSPRTYYRMFELYHAQVWPIHLVVLGSVIGVFVLLRREEEWRDRATAGVLAVCWLWGGDRVSPSALRADQLGGQVLRGSLCDPGVAPAVVRCDSETTPFQAIAGTRGIPDSGLARRRACTRANRWANCRPKLAPGRNVRAHSGSDSHRNARLSGALDRAASPGIDRDPGHLVCDRGRYAMVARIGGGVARHACRTRRIDSRNQARRLNSSCCLMSFRSLFRSFLVRLGRCTS